MAAGANKSSSKPSASAANGAARSGATPMMQQYFDAKAACPDAVLLFRMGDFYETFHDDAKLVARVLNLALTSRDKGENPIPMAGFPHHQLESYLGKLIAAGHRAAICEQVEDPRQAKGLVRREVTRVVTPGTVTDDALLDPHECNFLLAMVDGPLVGLAWVDLSTGRFLAAQIPPDRLADEIARIGPVECLLAEEADDPAVRFDERVVFTRRPGWVFSHTAARDALARHFGTQTLEGFGFEDDDVPAVRAAGAILEYLTETQKTSLGHIDRLTPYRVGQTLEIDEATRRSLEITKTMREGRREGSLLDVLDRTITAMGSRLLGDWVGNPLTDLKAIDERLDAVAELVDNAAAGRRITRAAQAHLRRRTLAGPRHDRSGQPARSELPGAHVADIADLEGQVDGPHKRAALAA